MIKKTEGIVLRTLRYQDHHLIATLYTRESGKRSFMVKGFRSSRSAKRFSYFQPLSIVDIVYRERPRRELQFITENRLAHIPYELQSHPIKLSLGLAMIEIFHDTVREERADPGLYDFLKNSLVTLDTADQNLIHVFIWFLLHLTAPLGFMPADKSLDSPYVFFDYKNGSFLATAQPKDPISPLLRRFLKADIQSCRQISFDNEQKRNLIQTLFAYYREHIDGFRYPQTLRVFAEVFE